MTLNVGQIFTSLILSLRVLDPLTSMRSTDIASTSRMPNPGPVVASASALSRPVIDMLHRASEKGKRPLDNYLEFKGRGRYQKHLK